MGRRQLTPGQPCRYGHPWDRSADGKRCLVCYLNTLPYELLSPAEKIRRQQALDARKKAWAEKREASAQRLRDARKKNENVSAKERMRRSGRLKDRYDAARRGLHAAAGPGVPVALKRELQALWQKQQGRCGLTGLPIEGVPHLDHVVPASKGGAHTVDNLQWTSAMANRAKGTHTVQEFEDWLLAAADALRARRQLQELF